MFGMVNIKQIKIVKSRYVNAMGRVPIIFSICVPVRPHPMKIYFFCPSPVPSQAFLSQSHPMGRSVPSRPIIVPSHLHAWLKVKNILLQILLVGKYNGNYKL